MAPPTQWTWVWVDSGSWWWTEGLACCGSRSRRESDTTEWLNWTDDEGEKEQPSGHEMVVSVWVVDPHDRVVDGEPWLATSSQHHERGPHPASLAQESFKIQKSTSRSGDLHGDPMAKSPCANAIDTGSIPGLGRSHMLWSNETWVPQLLSLYSGTWELQLLKPTHPRAHALQRVKTTAMRSLQWEALYPKWRVAQALCNLRKPPHRQQQRCSPDKNK